MDIAKAIISIGEASIQLEGPRDFVEKYLDQYKSIIEKKHAQIPTLPEPPKGPETQTPTPKRTRIVKPKTGPSCSGSVKNLISEGYFKEPRLREDVQKYLISKGLRFESSNVSAALVNCFNSGKLQRTGVGTNAKYYTNA